MAVQLTDHLFLDYLRCHRRAFLELYGEAEQRDPPGDYLQKLSMTAATTGRWCWANMTMLRWLTLARIGRLGRRRPWP